MESARFLQAKKALLWHVRVIYDDMMLRNDDDNYNIGIIHVEQPAPNKRLLTCL